MNIHGRFCRVSDTTYRDGVVLVGFLGSLFPHDLTPDTIKYIKDWYNMPNSTHEFFNEWPDGIEPAYQAAKKNFKNGFMLLKTQEGITEQ